MSRVTFNIAAKCDKAGRSQNQDNFWVCPNLDKIGDTSAIGNDSDVELSSKGALLVVADGMGGMKSGEKASEFVIEGIKSHFSNIPESILNDDKAIISFIKNAIIQSDQLIKAYAKDHKESEGMGSTIVLVWLLGEKAYCGWCGDSRIYCYNPQNSLVRLSHDHSYVQSLVDEGKITEDEAFDHPDGNIITRSLGDSGEAANPETKIYPIHRRDVFLLCSDGLCGLLNDEQIETILADNCTSSEDALKALWSKGQQEGWSDNATIEVACITEGGVTPTRKAAGYDEGKPKPVVSKNNSIKKDTNVMPNFWQTNKQYILIVAVVAIVAIGIIWFFTRDKKTGGASNQEFSVEQPGNDNNTVSDQGSNQNQGDNSQGNNPQNGHSQGSNPQNGHSQGGNPQNGHSQGGNPQNGHSQGGNPQNGNSQGGNPQNGNSQGGNPQNGNNQGGMYSDGPSNEYIKNLIEPTRRDYNEAKKIMKDAESKKPPMISERDMQSLGSYAYSVKDNLQEIKSQRDYNKLSRKEKEEIAKWETLEIEVNDFKNRFKPSQHQQIPIPHPGRGIQGNDPYGNPYI